MDKKTLIVGVMLLFLASCSSDKEKAEQKAPSAGEVINKYVDTLTTARPKAEEAKKAVEKKQEEEEKAIKDMDK